MNDDVAVMDMAGHLIRRLHQQSTHLFTQRTQAAGIDLTPVQFAALDAIHTHPGCDQSRVAELIGYDRATIGGVIERMLHKGWINRITSAKDRRSREISLTTEGNHLLQALRPVVKALQRDILLPLDDAEQAFFLHLMRRVVWASETTPKSAPSETP